MPYLNPPQNGAKPSSRFSTLNVFRLKSGSGSSLDPPPPPPKDPGYASSPISNPSLHPPPPALYSKSLFSRSTASLSPSLSPESYSGPATPLPGAGFEFGRRTNGALASMNGRAATGSPAPSASGGSLSSLSRGGADLSSPSVDGTDSSDSSPNGGSNLQPGANLYIYQSNGASASSYTLGQASTAGVKPKKSVFKLANLAKLNRSRKDLSDTASASGSICRSTSASVSEHEDGPERVEGDEGISLPWNFQHNIHVDEGYIGLPPSWSDALSKVGFDNEEIAAIHARRRAAVATAFASNTKSLSSHTTDSAERSTFPHTSTVTPPTIPTLSAPILLDPAPRSTSLGKGHGTLGMHPPSMYSDATSNGSNTTGGASPVSSPSVPSFSMKSFVSGIKSSPTSDSTSLKDGAGGSTGDERATAEEPGQYVCVHGDGPDEDGDQGVGDGIFVQPHPFDASSLSSHRTHTSRTRQGQQTPRTPTFPQIQVRPLRSDAGHVPFPSSIPCAPSPLAHSTSLPIPTPNGYTFPNHSTSFSSSHSPATPGSWAGPVSAPPRTPPRRAYHIMNPSSDSFDGEKYGEPPPAYISPREVEFTPQKEKEEFGAFGGPPPPNRPIPPTPAEETLSGPSLVGSHDSGEWIQGVFAPGNLTNLSPTDIPGTADEVLDISSYYGDVPVHGGNAEVDAQQARILPPTPPLVIDKRLTKLATLPPRISFHQEGSLEDWSKSLFSVIGGGGKRSSVLMGLEGRDAASMKERRTTIRPVSPGHPLAPAPVAPGLPDMSFGADLTLGPHARGKIGAVEESNEQEEMGRDDTAKPEEAPPEDDAGVSVTTINATRPAEVEVKEVSGSLIVRAALPLPVAPLGSDVSSLVNDLDPLGSKSSSLSESPPRTTTNSHPPPPPPKLTSKPPPLAPPRTNVITGISGRSPVNSLFGAKPQPLPIPIPLSQIRTQLRPAPPKPPHPPPTLPLPPLRRPASQANLQPSPPWSPLPLIPSQKALKHDSAISHVTLSDSRPNSSQTLHPIRTNESDRDSGLSTITVTPATIATAKTEVVRTAIASVMDSDAVSLASGRVGVVSIESPNLADDAPDMGREPPHTRERGEVPNEVSKTSSVSLLRDGPQSKWPAPPPPPVELGTDSTPRRVSRFRTTSLGRVTQLQAMGGITVASPISSHFSHGSSDTTSSSTSESVPLAAPKVVNGASPTALKEKGGLATEARYLISTTDTFGGVDDEMDDEQSDTRSDRSKSPSSKLQASIPSSTHPLLVQLQPYITPCNPASCFTNLVEIAEGESGSVFASHVVSSLADRQHAQWESTERPISPGTSLVAIKRIPLPPLASSPSLSDNSSVSNKLASVLHELSLLKNLDHEHLLLVDAVYVGPNSGQAEDVKPTNAVDTSLWIRMELMERSLADVIGLVAEGLVLQERLVGRFASDILHGLNYLQRQHIAHRDVRSDNLLVNATGMVKLADFSNAIRVDRNAPIVNGAVGVIYWQAPEMRAGPYNALNVDTWSLGATVWELAETVPPFSMPASPSTQGPFAIQSSRHVGSQWPPLTHPEHYSRAFHEFLRLCGRESAGRPGPGELLNTSFIRNACGRPVILQLLSQCRATEEAMATREVTARSS